MCPTGHRVTHSVHGPGARGWESLGPRRAEDGAVIYGGSVALAGAGTVGHGLDGSSQGTAVRASFPPVSNRGSELTGG